MSGALLRLENVSKRFGAAAALEGINLTAERGEFISLIGPSGCGKSTLLRLIAGLTAPTGGRVVVDEGPPGAAAEGMFYVFQDPTLLPWLRVRANVELPLQLRGVARPERRERALQMLKLVDLMPAADKYPWQLSGGMRMRVSIARALSVAPRILLLDEPFGALDEMTRDRLNEDLLALRESSPFTAFFVTHSVAEAVFLSTRIVVLSPSPGRLSATIDVPFPFPRRRSLRESPEFLRLLAQASHELRQIDSALR